MLDFSKGLDPDQLNKEIREFLKPVHTAFLEDITIKELLNHLQFLDIPGPIYYFYTIDDNFRLKGIISTRDILFNPPKTTLAEIADIDLIKLHERSTLHEALSILDEHQLLSAPVVNDNEILLGIFEVVSNQDPANIKKLPSREARDILQNIGTSVELNKEKSCFIEYKHRMPWLVCNITAGLICALIVTYYTEAITKFIVLATFIPLVLSLGESVSMQSVTLSLEMAKTPHFNWKSIVRRLFFETKVGFLLGLSSIISLVAFYFIFDGHKEAIWPISISIVLSMSLASTLGFSLPMALNSFGLNPKLASGPVALMLTDIAVTSIYLGFSSWWLLS